jgi:hypothetical protein
MEQEIWKDIKNFEGLYQISSLGRIKRLNSEIIAIEHWGKGIIARIIKERILAKAHLRGYELVSLKKNGKQTTRQVHRLVAETFIPNPLNKPQINHKDCNKENNHINNLEWVTDKENKEHAVLNGKMPKGEKSGKAKLNEFQVRVIRRSEELSERELAKIFKVHSTTIRYAIVRETWKHI